MKIPGISNKESKLRRDLGLKAWLNKSDKNDNYRDVREYTYSDVLSKYGLVQNIEPYTKRRLRFEAYLFSCLRNGLLDTLDYKNGIYKIGKDIKLIIKQYWLNKDNIHFPNKTWMK